MTAVVAARPNFVKMAPVIDALLHRGRVGVRVLHTGQHYDPALSDSFFAQLGMPAPDENLGVGSGTHAEQTARVLVGVESSLQLRRPDALVVAGDVNSTLAAALAAAKLGVAVVHIESGLRSGDWTMPEEINRVLTDRLADLLLCTSADALDNLAAEGIVGESVTLVGNTMIDSLWRLVERAKRSNPLGAFGLQSRRFVLVTLHRPALVDDDDRLAAVLAVLDELAAELPVVFPVHPRTRERIGRLGDRSPRALRLLEPLPYLEFLSLERAARLVITDSGGVQEETSALGVPCLTYRTTTERPVTIERGTNRLIGTRPEALAEACREEFAIARDFAAAAIPLWEGQAGGRAAEAIESLIERRATTPAH
ncbi:MAG: non-hydrolyzing UDP-N-acetylglucosamine 2-epimerase [Solirubrobacteraceae bacterium]